MTDANRNANPEQSADPSPLDSPAGQALRQKAEERLRKYSADSSALSPDDAQSLLHELHVRQIELDLQNDELRRAQVELQVSRARYFDLFDLAPVGYLTLSESGLILEANLTAANLLGVERSQLVKRPISRFIFSEDREIYYLHRKQLFETGAPQVCELRMVKMDGAPRPAWAHLQAVTTQGSDGAPACRITLTDITERKTLQAKSEEALRELDAVIEQRVEERTQELSLANLDLARAVWLKDEFLANMSHDLRTPLTGILGMSESLQEGVYGPLNERQMHSVQTIESSGRHLLALISGILDLSKIGAGTLDA